MEKKTSSDRFLNQTGSETKESWLEQKTRRIRRIPETHKQSFKPEFLQIHGQIAWKFNFWFKLKKRSLKIVTVFSFQKKRAKLQSFSTDTPEEELLTNTFQS